MEISSSNSENEMEMIDVEDDPLLIYRNIFLNKNMLMSEESEEPDEITNKQPPYTKTFLEYIEDKNKIKSSEEIKEVNICNKGNKKFGEMNKFNNNFTGTTEVINVPIKITPEIFKVFKEEDYILFCPAKKMIYYTKYTSKFMFNIWKDKQQRKDKIDEIMKKIKSRFFKAMKSCINKIFENNGIKRQLDYLPQEFIANVYKTNNKLMLEKTLEEIIIENKNNNSKAKKKQSKSKNNLDLLDYLKENLNNKRIRKIYKIFNTNIKDLYNEYLKSEQFEESIVKLKEEGNYSSYIQDYINKAKNFINYFSN